MKLLTKQTDYAVRALGYLAGRRGIWVPSGEIARAERIPDAFLRRIMRVLIKEGIVAAREGKRGGVTLASAPSSVRLTRLIELFQGPVTFSECVVQKKLCPNRATCALRKILLRAEGRLVDDIKNTRLSDLAPHGKDLP